MNVHKFVAVGGLAIGAVLALAPLASADPDAAPGAAATDPVTSLFSSEVAGLNSQFDLDTLFTGVYSDVTPGTTTYPYDIITPADVTTVQGTGTTPFDYLIYGVDPNNAVLAGDPGSYTLFNGAEAKFIDAFNESLYGAANSNAVDLNSGDFIGSPTSIAEAASYATATDAADYYYNYAIGDLSGFFQTNLTFLDIPASAF